MALSVEVGELMEHFQWLTEAQSHDLNDETRGQVEEEIGDVMLYLIRLADQLGIDPIDAAQRKIRKNAEKYPVEKAKGNASKYTDL
jgi:NTP pyrophosphatase (non-canonical NTP hydrolase)